MSWPDVKLPPQTNNSLLSDPQGGGGGGTASLRVDTQNKTTDPWLSVTTALSHCPCWFTAPCFQGFKGQPIAITVVTATCPQWTSFSVVLIQFLLQL